MSIFEYDEEKHMKSERKEWWEIGYREGHGDGVAEGLKTGSNNLAGLLQSLMDAEKTEEVKRVISDSDYQKNLLKEYLQETPAPV